MPGPSAESPHASRQIMARALILGNRIDTRRLEAEAAPLAIAPLTIALPEEGIAVLFRYGVVVTFDAGPGVEAALCERLHPLLTEPDDIVEREEARIRVSADAEELVEPSGTIVLRDAAIERLQLVADALAKSIVLSHFESRMAFIFDRIEPLAKTLAATGRFGGSGRELMRHIGEVMLIQQEVVGRMETSDKPELLWERPDLERLYVRLEEEFELSDRDRSLDRKLAVVSDTAETLLGLVQNRSSLRVEWYIVLLIVFEIVLTLGMSYWPL